MATSTAAMSREGVEDEIAFTEACIQTLQPEDLDFEERKTELEKKMEDLESQLAALEASGGSESGGDRPPVERRSTQMGSSQSQQHPYQSQSNGVDKVLDWPTGSASARKRSLDETSSSAPQYPHSKRPTPSPRVSTPASGTGLPNGWWNPSVAQPIADPSPSQGRQRILNRRREQEKRLEELRRQHRADEEYAKQLQNSFGDGTPPSCETFNLASNSGVQRAHHDLPPVISSPWNFLAGLGANRSSASSSNSTGTGAVANSAFQATDPNDQGSVFLRPPRGDARIVKEQPPQRQPSSTAAGPTAQRPPQPRRQESIEFLDLGSDDDVRVIPSKDFVPNERSPYKPDPILRNLSTRDGDPGIGGSRTGDGVANRAVNDFSYLAPLTPERRAAQALEHWRANVAPNPEFRSLSDRMQAARERSGQNNLALARKSQDTRADWPLTKMPGAFPEDWESVDGRYEPPFADDYLREYDYLYNDPARSKEDIERLLANIRPDEELNLPAGDGTPLAMKSPLYKHQVLGLMWLSKMEEGSNKGGILADDMGLGKTIQALALIVSRKSPDPLRKTTLIIAPVALMRQWEREIKNRVKSGHHALTVFIYHGQAKAKMTFSRLRGYDIVLTTFGTLAQELTKKDRFDIRRAANPDAVPDRSERLCLLGDDCKWYRVIIDEAQCIKNKNTKTAAAASRLQSVYRLCMTGTPMMNSIEELYSLIHFLRIKPYNELQNFNRDFTRPIKAVHPVSRDQAMQRLQGLLKAILLRRTKTSKLDGEPIIRLPERKTEIVNAKFGRDQLEFYKALETQTQLQFNKYLKAGTVGRNYSNMLVLLLRLRQACCHPHLIKDFGVEAPGELSDDERLAIAKQLARDVVDRIKATEGNFECPVCMDAVENPAIFFPCGHDTCVDCFSKISDAAGAGEYGDDSNTGPKCPECRGKIDAKKLTDWNSFKRVHMTNTLEEGERVYQEPNAESETESENDSEDETDLDEDSDLDGFIVKDDDEVEEQDAGATDSELEREEIKPAAPKKKSKVRRENERKGKAKIKQGKKQKTLAELKKESTKNIAARRKYLRRLAREWETSAKIDKTLEILENIPAGEKTIIFSQFTSFLDLIEVPIAEKGVHYKRYDGSMSAKTRNDAVEDFTDRPDCCVMLVSLKAGNAGLNLTAANNVVILDPFWNPYIEEQAIDRAHRIGQRREVKVHRVLVEDTVEDRIIALQEKKRQLIGEALSEQGGRNVARLGVQELAFLFGVSMNAR